MKDVRCTAWSASRVSTYETCPAQIGFRLKGFKEPENTDPNHPLNRGTRIHAEGESYLKTPRAQVPASFNYFAARLRALKKRKAKAELELAFREDWSSCGWFDADAWCRMKLDAVVLSRDAHVVDYKTGKRWPNHEAQIDLYAVGMFHAFDTVRTMLGEFWYLDLGGEPDAWEFPRDELPRLQRMWEERATPLLEDTTFEPRPGRHCKRCGYAASKGGPCEAEQ